MSHHIRRHHDRNVREYYDTHLKDIGEGSCRICGNQTIFKGLGEGYTPTCSRVCGGILHRQRLSADLDRHDQFKAKVAANMTKEWNRRLESGDIDIIRNKISDFNKKTLEGMTREDRILRFSRYHKCSPETIMRLNDRGRQQLLNNHITGKSGYKSNMKGKFKPLNPQKYKGDSSNIIYRSSWELKLLMHLDAHPDVIEYSSEEVVIPYRSPIDNRVHRYFVDFYVKKKNRDGLIESCLIEVKPKYQTQPPKVQTKPTKKYITEVQTWGVNSAKWDAAREYCKARNWNFYIFTEYELGIKTP